MGLAGSIAAAWAIAAWGLDAYGRRPLPLGEHYDAIVVAGCRVMPDGRPSPALARRVRLAVRLFQEGRAPLLVCTGGKGIPVPPLSEAQAAARLAVSLGVPQTAVLEEGESRTTWENASFTAKLLEAERVCVVSDSCHIFRCRRMFGRFFPHVTGTGVRLVGRSRWRQAFREVGAVLRHGLAGRM
ncbi:MAG: YdcF family protein [Myxococcota bacterium]